MNDPRRRIDPQRGADPAAAARSVSDPGNPALSEWAQAGLEAPDMDTVRQWRLSRLRAELARRQLAAAVLTDPIAIRYATDCRNMQLFCMHNMVRYAFVATDGPVVLFDAAGCEHVAQSLIGVDELRPAVPMSYFDAGPREGEHVCYWAREIAALTEQHGGSNGAIAVDRMPPGGDDALRRHGLEPTTSYAVAEHARSIKHPEEIKAMRRAIHTAETGMWRMWQELRPGRTTENELWSWLHQANIARGGEWIETRLLASGPRTNPWFQECSDRVIEAGDLVSFDTDLIGPYGYCADISRAWTAGSRPSQVHRDLLDIACEHIEANAELLRAGTALREISERSHRLPPDCRANRYPFIVHGIGLCDEYPAVRYPEDWERCGYDGTVEAGMVLCIEAYVGREGGHEGVKLERQALVRDDGVEFLDAFPLSLVPAA